MIPPETTYTRAMVFNVPRDSRFSDVEAVADALLLAPPAGEPVWIDLGAVSASDTVAFVDCDDFDGGAPFQVDEDGAVVQPVIASAAEDAGGP